MSSCLISQILHKKRAFIKYDLYILMYVCMVQLAEITCDTQAIFHLTTFCDLTYIHNMLGSPNVSILIASLTASL